MELMTIKEASKWASSFLNKNVTTANISYLVNYGKIQKHNYDKIIKVSKKELIEYYKSYNGNREINWKEKLGDDLNWALSFDNLKEKDTTKHIHRLHPYKGKFIPQLVEYFIDNHTDNFKKEVYFHKGDIILDPFSGSGTTLVQANELEMHAIGVDISAFNTLISNVKISKVDFTDLVHQLNHITIALKHFIDKNNNSEFERELVDELNVFNKQFFPSPEFKIKIKKKEINEKAYSIKKQNEFLPIFNNLVSKYKLDLRQKQDTNFLDKWYLKPVRDEIDFVFNLIKDVQNNDTKKILTIILSRTIRSCRATTHADLATLKNPIVSTYYCKKHGKICKPLFSIFSWWQRYSKDTVKRLEEFDRLRTNTMQICLKGDSRDINIIEEVSKKNIAFGELLKKQKIDGIFSSPPYVGLINYHEQHAYAYDLFGFERNDELEIGPLFKGQGLEARKTYIEGISKVLLNSKEYLKEDYNIFLVANDKYNMYPKIAELSGMKIVNQYKRPVLNRTEKNKSAYAEIIFHLKEK